MLKWTSLKKNNTFKVYIVISFLSILLGGLFYFKLKNNININDINLQTLIKNHSIYHILFVSFIYFLSFLLVGGFFGLVSYCFEVICLVILGITLFNNWHIKGLILFIIIIIFKIIYLLLLIYLITRSFKISKIIINRQNFSRDRKNIYFKEAICTCLIIILIETLNFLVGYKIITFFTKLLQIMI